MFRCVVFCIRNTIEWNCSRFFKHTKLHTCGEKIDDRLIDSFFINSSFTYCLNQMRVCTTTIQVTTVIHSHRYGFHRCICYMMIFMEITHCPAVTDNVPLKSPFFSQNILQKCLTAAAWFSICPVICTHHSFYFSFLHTGFKCRQISLIHILFGCNSIKIMSLSFRSGMYSKMLCTGCCLHIYRIISLKCLNKPHAQA